jgi:hypothetical protein
MREALNQLQEEQEKPCKYRKLLNNFIDSVTSKRGGQPVHATPSAKRAPKHDSPSQSHATTTTTPTTQSQATLPTTQVSALSVDSATTNNTNVPVAVEVHQWAAKSVATSNKPVHGVTVVANCCAGMLCGIPTLDITFNRHCSTIDGIQHRCSVRVMSRFMAFCA